MANVELNQKMIPFITCEIPLLSMSANWFLVSQYLIRILESKLFRSDNQWRATLWVLETCLILGLLPAMIILITGSLSSNTKNKASWGEDWTFEWTVNIIQRVDLPLRSWTSVNDNQSPRSLCSLRHVSQNRNNQIQHIESGNPVQFQSCIQRDDFGFCCTVRNGSLFLAHPTYWNKRMTSKNTQYS